MLIRSGVKQSGTVVSPCGKQSCPYICVRVCHCPAGLARMRELLALARNKREALHAKK